MREENSWKNRAKIEQINDARIVAHRLDHVKLIFLLIPLVMFPELSLYL